MLPHPRHEDQTETRYAVAKGKGRYPAALAPSPRSTPPVHAPLPAFLARLGAIIAALPLSGCLLLSYNELEPFATRPLHQRVTLMPRINWIARDDATLYCLSLMKQTGVTPPVDPPFACSFWSKEDQLCTIVTHKHTTHSFLGHELRHCFEGNFHEDLDLARRPFPAPSTSTVTAVVPRPDPAPTPAPAASDTGTAKPSAATATETTTETTTRPGTTTGPAVTKNVPLEVPAEVTKSVTTEATTPTTEAQPEATSAAATAIAANDKPAVDPQVTAAPAPAPAAASENAEAAQSEPQAAPAESADK